MTSLSSKNEHARAMLRAGNYQRVKELCREILEKEDDNVEAFETLFETHMAKNDMAKALAICNWRLERVPECPRAHTCKFLPMGHWKQKKEAAKLIETVRRRFGDHPFYLQQCEILYSHFFKNSSHTLWLIKGAREKGVISELWLADIERMERGHSGQIFSSQKLLVEALERDPEDYESVFSLSVTRFYVGRLFSAIKLGRQAKRLNPQRAAECNEVIFASYMGLVPFFWGAQLFIIWVATVTTRIPWLLRSPLNIAGLIMAFVVQGIVLMPVIMLLESIFGDAYASPIAAVVPISVGLQIIWILYLLFGFQHIGRRFADSKKDVKLSKKY